MESIRNKHKGKRIWVCGSGGSLLDVIPSKIPKEDIVIACNSATYHFKGFNYGVFTDGMANYSNWYLNLKKKPCTIILLNKEEIPVIKRGTIILEKEYEKWKFKEDDTKIIGGYDVIHCAVHIAWLMGASEIILAGVDLKHYSDTQKHVNNQDVIESAPDGIKEAIRESIQANESLFDGNLGLSLGGWNLIYEYNQLNITSIATEGNLKLYPLIPFNEICK